LQSLYNRTISVYHKIKAIQDTSLKGSKDISFVWDQPNTNIKIFFVTSSLFTRDTRKQATAIYSGGHLNSVWANPTTSNVYPYQRPALHELDSYNTYYSSTYHTEVT
jgi:hypothetical protein